MDAENVKEIILNAVKKTEPTWRGFDVHWADMDEVFLSRAYDQMGFDNWLFIKFLQDNQIFEIDKVGSILDGNYERKYNREFAGSLEAPLYQI